MSPAEGPRKLPDFTNPPVIEVALSVVFQSLPGYNAAHAGLFWHRVASRFTRAEEQPQLAILSETEFPQPAENVVQIALGEFPRPRIWLVSADDSELIQLQHDTFAHNWRKGPTGQPYPRYEHIRARFHEEFQRFSAFADESGFGSPVPERCEITYVNHIPAGVGWKEFGEIDAVLSSVAPRSDRATFLRRPDEARYSAKYAIRDRTGQFLGRLSISGQPAFRRSDRHPLIVLTLTSRGRPVGAGTEGVLAFFDVGREWIVRGFADLTTEEMHRVWGRTE